METLQEHLHVRKPQPKRFFFVLLIMMGAMFGPSLIGCRMRLDTYAPSPVNHAPADYHGYIVEYQGYKTYEAYGYQTNQEPPLFIIIPPFMNHKDIYGFKWLMTVNHDSYYHY